MSGKAGWRKAERVAEVMLGCHVRRTDLEALDRMAAQDNVSRADVVRRIIRNADAERQAERQATNAASRGSGAAQ